VLQDVGGRGSWTDVLQAVCKQQLCCRMSVDVETGLMYFKLYQSAQLVDAYKEAMRIVVSCIVIQVMFVRLFHKLCM